MLYTQGSPQIKKEIKKKEKKKLLTEAIFLPIMLLNLRTSSSMEACTSVYAYHHHMKTGERRFSLLLTTAKLRDFLNKSSNEHLQLLLVAR